MSNLWNGYCPESLHQGKNVRMRLNHNDFWESEETGLQICVVQDLFAVILNFRGEGKFPKNQTYADDISAMQILAPQHKEFYPFTNFEKVFQNTEEVIEYINQF